MPDEIYSGDIETLLCFLRSEYTTIVYHTLFKKFPKGCRNKDMSKKTGIGTARTANIFNVMCKRGLAEREKEEGGFYVYRHVPLKEPQIMDVMERSATYEEAYNEIEWMWYDKKNSIIQG